MLYYSMLYVLRINYSKHYRKRNEEIKNTNETKNEIKINENKTQTITEQTHQVLLPQQQQQ